MHQLCAVDVWLASTRVECLAGLVLGWLGKLVGEQGGGISPQILVYSPPNIMVVFLCIPTIHTYFTVFWAD